MRITFGLHKGKLISEICDDYLRWMQRTINSDWGKLAQLELERRSDAAASSGAPRHEVIRLVTACNDLSQGRQLHSQVATYFNQDVYIANLLIQMYARCGSVDDARVVFDGIDKSQKSAATFSWGMMQNAYLQNRCLKDAELIFQQMPEKAPVAWNAMISAYGKHGQVQNAKKTFDSMPDPNLISWNAMLAAFTRCGDLLQSKNHFDRMPQRNCVSWTALLSAYGENGCLEEAVKVFERLPSRNVVASGAMVAVFAQNGHLEGAQEVFDRTQDKDTAMWNAMLDGIVKNGSLDQAKLFFDSMPERNKVASIIMINAFAAAGDLYQAVRTFERMQRWDMVSWTSMLHAFACSGHLTDAKKMFDSVEQKDEALCTAMIVAYARKGMLENGKEVFDQMGSRNRTTWNRMIRAFAQSGQCMAALELFRLMQLEGVAPDEDSFASLLGGFSLGSRRDLIQQARVCFLSMVGDYSVEATKEHYKRIVEALGTAGHLQQAEELVDTMPLEPDCITWMKLLGACKELKDVKRGRRAAEEAILLNPWHGQPYVVMASLYEEAGLAQEAEEMRRRRLEKGVDHQLGRSSVELSGKAYEFVVTSAGSYERIAPHLKKLEAEMAKKHGFQSRSKSWHSEKIALAFVVLQGCQDKLITIQNSLRMCGDCHSFMKLASGIIDKIVVVKDPHQVHCFKRGQCSCELV